MPRIRVTVPELSQSTYSRFRLIDNAAPLLNTVDMLNGTDYRNGGQLDNNLPVSCANYISPLQKAVMPAPPSDHGSFLQHCFDVFLSSSSPDSSLFLPICGGSDSGMFCVVGDEFDSSRMVYHDVRLSPPSSSRLKAGDIILSINEYEISGFTCRDAVQLLDNVTRVNCDPGGTGPLVRIRACSPSALATGNSTLSSFLAFAFPQNSAEYTLQEKIRENVYQRVVPCTTRLPRADEVDGVHYHFLSVPEFLALERAGFLLESGVYKGENLIVT
ncbi:unnamed protein product [Dicrocoelium dendriticum]|nr:unnamed protein product [Dicrocoelium dendriticum]